MAGLDDLKSKSNVLLTRSNIHENQYVSCTDILSEGPILGLPNGAASIYLDKSPAADTTAGGQQLTHTGGTATTTANSKNVTTSNLVLNNFTSTTSMKKYLQLLDFYEASGVNGVKQNVQHQQVTLTKAGFFTNAMVASVTDNYNIRPWVEVFLNNERVLYGYIESISGNDATLKSAAGMQFFSFVDKTSGEYNIKIHATLEIDTINNNAITLKNNAPAAVTKKCSITDTIYTSDVASNPLASGSNDSKYKNFRYQFRDGRLMQSPISDVYGGSGSTSITVTPNLEITYPDVGTTWPTTSPGQTVTAIERTSSDLNLSASTVRQVDELRVVFNYPQGLIVKSVSGGIHHGLAAYL